MYPENWPQFFTATIQGWKYLLKDDRFKGVILDSLHFLVKNNKVKINAYVIMSNHIHLIWQATAGNNLMDIQTSFKKFTAQQFLKLLRGDAELNNYQVNAVDRKHHFWKRNSLGIELFTLEVFKQKLDYIHNNPVSAGICNYAGDYKYSSAMFYERDIDEFGILEHYMR
jgi:putative transposase